MGAPVRTTRERWIEQGLKMLAAGGPDAVRVEPMASELGVTKGGFYGQFADRQELLEAMLDAWEKEAVDDATRGLRVPASDATEAKANIERAGWATFPPGYLRDVELAIRDWARRDPDVRKRLRRVDSQRLDFLKSQFALLHSDPREVEARSLLAFCLGLSHDQLTAPVRGKRELLDIALRVITD